MLIYYGECYSQSRIEELVDAVLADNKNIENHKYIRLDAKKIKRLRKNLAIMLSFIVGIFVLLNQKIEYNNTDLYIMEKSKTVGGQRGACISSAITTYAFALVPYVGPILGPAIGLTAGQYLGKGIGEWIGTDSQEAKDEERARIKKSLASTNETGEKLFGVLEGDYSVSELKDIERALNDGVFKNSEVSPELLEKMQANGNELFFSDKVSRSRR